MTALLCVAFPLHVKYLQLVESIAQCGVHLRRPYDLHAHNKRNTMHASASQQHDSATNALEQLGTCDSFPLCYTHPGRYELHVW